MTRQRLVTQSATIDRNSLSSSPFLEFRCDPDFGSRGTNSVILILEPVTPRPEDAQLAEAVIERIDAELDRRRGQTATAALLAALEITNDWLVQANAIRPPDRRVQFGFTCVLSRGEDLYIAQAPPSQVLIGQEGELYAFPALESWRWHRRESDDESPPPLGNPTGIEPEIYHTRLEPGDTVVVCSTSLAAVLDREPQDVFVQPDAGRTTEHLEAVARTYGIEEAYAFVVTAARPGKREPNRDVEFLRKVSDWCCNFLPEETAERIRRRVNQRPAFLNEVDLDSESVHTVDYTEIADDDLSYASAAWVEADGDTTAPFRIPDEAFFSAVPNHNPEPEVHDDAESSYWNPAAPSASAAPRMSEGLRKEGRKLNELIAGAVLALSAAVVGVWQLAVNRDRPIHGPRDDGTLGLPRLNRYDDSIQMPRFTGVRRRMPRAPISKLTGVVALLLIILLAVGFVVSTRANAQRERTAKIEGLLQTAVGQRQQALQAGDPAVAQAFLLAAAGTIREAEALGLNTEQAAQEQAAIQMELDRALKVERLANVQVVGAVPAAPEGVTPRVFSGNGQIYVFTDALYRLDSDGTTLIRLIGTGDRVGDQTVGTLQSAAWGDGAPMVFDGSAAYLFDPSSGSWSRESVGTFGSPYTGVVSMNGYGGNLYLLSPETGQILKFPAGSFEAQPEDWTAGLASEDLSLAADMEIDGRIHTLINDGRILTFYMGALETTMSPQVVPPVKNAVGMSVQPDRPFLYIADGRNRILRLNREGQIVQQFQPGEGNHPFDGIRDIAVDDALGTAYVLTDQALLNVRLPAPPR